MKDTTPDALQSATERYFLLLRFLGSATFALACVLTVFVLFFPGNRLFFWLMAVLPLAIGFCTARCFQEQRRSVGKSLTFSFMLNRACALLLIFFGGSILAIFLVLLALALLSLVGFGRVIATYASTLPHLYFFSVIGGVGGLEALFIWFRNRIAAESNP